MATYPEATAQFCNVAGYIQDNYTAYHGDGSFLAGPTERTTAMWNKCMGLLLEEVKKGILDTDVDVACTITSHKAGYILENTEDEVIKGLQADAPLKRTLKPAGGARIVYKALKSYGYDMDPKIWDIYTQHRITHNDAVFAMYTDEMRHARHVGIVTGLPDGYGRGRIIGDYRRIALYGINQLIAWKEEDKKLLDVDEFSQEVMQRRHEITQQIAALKEIIKMGEIYGDDLSRPAQNAREAVQWTYYGYLAGVKQQDGAAMSFGRVDAFFDCFFEKDLQAGVITESEAQEIIDQFVIKLRLVRHLRAPEYNDLFAGDPTWVTCVLGGMTESGETLVTKTSFRMLNTLYNLGPAPEPNITILWSEKLPETFKKFACKVSVDTSSIQYENDDLMRSLYGDDYAIACCVSAMRVGKDMQYFGARVNLAKLLLYTLNDGKDEIYGSQIGPQFGGHEGDGQIMFDELIPRYKLYMNWLAKLYVKTMNCIHYSHDLYAYESAQLALHDSNVRRFMAFGIAGLSCVADSLSAIKYAKVMPVRDERGLITDFNTEGEFPCFGNDDKRVDDLAVFIVEYFMNQLRLHPAHRGATHTLSILTITSNVVYGRKTGTTPDGRKHGEPLAPGANPMHGRDSTGAIHCLNSIARIPYRDAMDGISLTFSIIPSVLGKESDERVMNLANLLDGYFLKSGHHINVNVLRRETLLDAQAHPENYPQLTIRVSGYAILFNKLSKAQQDEVIARTFHAEM